MWDLERFIIFYFKLRNPDSRVPLIFPYFIEDSFPLFTLYSIHYILNIASECRECSKILVSCRMYMLTYFFSSSWGRKSEGSLFWFFEEKNRRFFTSLGMTAWIFGTVSAFSWHTQTCKPKDLFFKRRESRGNSWIAHTVNKLEVNERRFFAVAVDDQKIRLTFRLS